MSHGARSAPSLAVLLILALGLALTLPAPARAGFGLLPGAQGFDVAITGEGGQGAEIRAGAHPYSIITTINFRIGPAEPGGPFSDGDLRDLDLALPAGLIENPSAVSRCGPERFHTPRSSPFEVSRSGESCPATSQIGIIEIRSAAAGAETRSFGLFNLRPPPGFPAQIGASPFGVPLVFTPRLRDAGGEYGSTLQLRNFSQRFDLSGFTLRIWGNPWGLSHNGQRGNCLNELEPGFPWAKCPIAPPQPDHEPHAYLTLPTSCGAPLGFELQARAWGPSAALSANAPSRDSEGDPAGLSECETLSFAPLVTAQPTNPRASSASGFEFSLTPKEEALTNYRLRVPSQPRRAIVSLPEGMTLNPSVAAGLGVCSPSAYAAETASSPLGAGCPENSKLGSFTVQSPLFTEPIAGAIYLAQPDDRSSAVPAAENPFDSLLALYLIAKAPARGVIVKLAGRLDPDPTSGDLIAGFDRLPQLPYSNLKMRFREGQRAPLISPPACGDFLTRVELTPWNDPGAGHRSEPGFQISKGIGPDGACPEGTPPFAPEASGGTLNGNSGSYTPFYLHLTRRDSEQEIVSYSAQLPEGLTGRLAGVGVCPDAAIAAARHRTGVEELRDPSCPPGAQVGRTFSGYGVGSVLSYAPGHIYLAGPWHGSPLSIVAINSAAVGPFDLGTIVIRSAFQVDPRSARLQIDSAASDPIPHILRGVPLHLRDIRIYIDRPDFTLNPTSCEAASFTSTLGGAGALFGDPLDDTRAATSDLFQVSNCSARGFAPRLRLRGSPRRARYPALRAVLRPRPGDANIERVTVSLPATAFLAQNHIREVCSRVAFERAACPGSAVYGRAVAETPLLDGPLRGPVYLRSSDNPLPDLVADLRSGAIRIILSGSIDSVGQGRIRAVFDDLPDAPLNRFVLSMQGARKGLLVNSADLCRRRAYATALLLAHNNRGRAIWPRAQPSCAKGRRRGDRRAPQEGRR